MGVEEARNDLQKRLAWMLGVEDAPTHHFDAIDRLIEEVRKEMLGNFCAYCGKNVCGQTTEELAKEQVSA